MSADLEITPEQARDAVAAGDAILVDVRSPAEWEAGRIAGATHIDLTELSARASELPADKQIVFTCRVGGRSLMAAQAFAASGLNAKSLAGGAIAWTAAGLPFDGEVAEH
ncbi:MAG: rhodanese-like domain-containing protein [Solirubrobacteraceae bacterium]|nr:rhodanese-like domain-containing protein [Solirubrobacteraceae bacterium]